MRALASIGDYCGRHALAVIAAWVLAFALATAGASGLADRLFEGSGDIAESQSLRVDALLREDFPRSAAPALVLTMRSASLDRRPGELADLLFELKLRWFEEPIVTDVIVEADVSDRRLLPAPGTGHLALVTLDTENALSAEQAVPRLRAVADPILRAARQRHPDLEWALTGRSALTFDLNRFNTEDAARAELLALPLALLILVVAFRSLTAAALPLIVAVTSTTVALGLLSLVARWMILSNLVPSLVTMIGLAIGIDYSLFLVHRYRRALARLALEEPGLPLAALGRAALRDAMSTAGVAVLYSGLTVFIGMAGLIVTPLMQTHSVGLAGCMVVATTLLLSLTLLPALLTLLGPSRLEWPSFISRHLGGRHAQVRWDWWARFVTLHPVSALAASLAALALLAAPALETRFGFPEGQFLPAELEYARGLEMLHGMRLRGLVSPIPVILTDVRGRPALTPERVPGLVAFSSRLRQDPRVAFVQGPVDLAADWPAERYAAMYADLDRALADSPLLRTQFVNADATRILMWVIPSEDCTLEDTKQLAEAIPGWMRIAGLRIDVGGQPQYYNDYDAAVESAYVGTFSFVLLASFLVLLLLFRAPVVAIKALLLNAFSVLAGYGAVVFVFQLGYGSSWLGVIAPTEVVPLNLPLIIFCILFGLSMDYEVFLLSRVKAIYDRTGDNEVSIRLAVAQTGAVITNAALIMVVVFGAFMFARVVLVQMLGLGLAVAVLVDATLIRSMLGPALMQFAGRWNWWSPWRRFSR